MGKEGRRPSARAGAGRAQLRHWRAGGSTWQAVQLSLYMAHVSTACIAAAACTACRQQQQRGGAGPIPPPHLHGVCHHRAQRHRGQGRACGVAGDWLQDLQRGPGRQQAGAGAGAGPGRAGSMGQGRAGGEAAGALRNGPCASCRWVVANGARLHCTALHATALRCAARRATGVQGLRVAICAWLLLRGRARPCLPVWPPPQRGRGTRGTAASALAQSAARPPPTPLPCRSPAERQRAQRGGRQPDRASGQQRVSRHRRNGYRMKLAPAPS